MTRQRRPKPNPAEWMQLSDEELAQRAREDRQMTARVDPSTRGTGGRRLRSVGALIGGLAIAFGAIAVLISLFFYGEALENVEYNAGRRDGAMTLAVLGLFPALLIFRGARNNDRREMVVWVALTLAIYGAWAILVLVLGITEPE
jgi:uncharacterized membrane protein